MGLKVLDLCFKLLGFIVFLSFEFFHVLELALYLSHHFKVDVGLGKFGFQRLYFCSFSFKFSFAFCGFFAGYGSVEFSVLYFFAGIVKLFLRGINGFFSLL